MFGFPPMTQPSAFGHKAIWNIAAPMMLSGISAPLLGIVDTAVVGHLDGPEYLAAVATGATIFNMLFMSLNFLRMGTTGMTAQAFGAQNSQRQLTGLQQPLAIAFAIAAALILLQKPLLAIAIALLGPGELVAGLSADYFSIRILSAPFALANFVIIGWLLGMQNARGPLVIMLVLNISNVLLDLLLVVGLDMAVRGVALATLLAELLALATGIWFVRATLSDAGIRASMLAWHGGERIGRLLNVNGSLFVRTLTLMFTFAFITAQGARLGDLTLATNAVLMNFLFLLSYALDGIAHAAEALTGKALGQRNRDGIELTVRRTLFWSLIFAALFVITYLVAGNLLIAALTDLPEVRDHAVAHFPWLIVLPFAAVWSFLYDGVFVGLTRTREMCSVMLASTFLIFLPVWYFTQEWDNHALWFALIMFMTVRSAGMHGWYRWLRKQDLLLRTA
jgi:MATE family multidrug resistance protein